MKKLLLIINLVLWAILSSAQTATDFTADDCNGVTHNLFTELDAGRVIVITWVMPCGGCIGPASTSRDIVQSFQEPFSNKINVYYYLVDDYGDIECSMFEAWANQNAIPASAYSFRFSDSNIDMMDYGSYGMPKTIVLGGGSNHTVFFEEDFTLDEQALSDAIETALASTGIDEINQSISKYKIFPNPASHSSEINFMLDKTSDIRLNIYNLQAKRIESLEYKNLSAGGNRILLNLEEYNSGRYLIELSDGKTSRFLNLAITK